MKGITTLAALPSGAGQAAALPAEVGEEREYASGGPVAEGSTLRVHEGTEAFTPFSTVTMTFNIGDDARAALKAALMASPVRKAAVECRANITALGSEAPAVAIGPRHTPNDGRGPRDVYVDGILAPNCLEADTAEGWAILHREAGPGEFAPGGVQFTRRGKVQVFPAGTVRP